MNKNKKKIVIIGAGPAGLSAAWKLINNVKENYEVVILEAAANVGGMAKTVICDGNKMDVGGHRFFSKEKAVLDWWREILPEEEPEEFLLRERKTSIYYKNKFFDYPVVFNLENIKKMGRKNACQIGVDYLKIRLHPLKEKSLEDFYINRFGKALYEMFFEGYTHKLCGVSPKEISPEWGKQRVRGLSIEAILKGHREKRGQQTGDGLLSPFHFYYPKNGPGQLWETVAEQVISKGAKLYTDCQVTEIYRDEVGNVISVLVKTPCGTELIQGDFFISTMPLRELIRGMEHVPAQVAAIAEKLPYRAMVSVGLLVDKLAVSTKDCWIYVQDEQVKTGRIQFYNNWSPHLSKEKVFIALEYFCKEGDALWSMQEEAAFKLAIEEAVKIGILEENVQVFAHYRERIAQAYPGYYGAYEELGKVKDYLGGIKNLYCIGRNGLHRYWNMDKCILSAWEAAEAIKEADTF